MSFKQDPNKRDNQKPSTAFGTQMPAANQAKIEEPVDSPSTSTAYRTFAPPVRDVNLTGAATVAPSSSSETAQSVTGAHGTVRLPSPQGFRSVYKSRPAEDRELRATVDHFATSYIESGKDVSLADKSEAIPPVPKQTRSGKSTWKLLIRQRSLKGNLSGVRNTIPTSHDDAQGFLSALIEKPDAAEYEVVRELGAGNMGVVYEALQTSLNRELAIKSLKPSDEMSDYEQEMFVSEAVVTANLVHPNIVPIHDLGRTSDGKLFYSMKKVTGTPWDEQIRQRPLEENLEIFMKVCDAVAYAHSRGVINRDLKPENVVVGNYGEVIVLDWGLAITTSKFPKNDSILQDFRGGAGTPVYMAPELINEDAKVIDHRTDIYLLGAILFEVLEGFPPHLLRAIWHVEDPNEQFTSIINAVMFNQIEQDVSHPGELMDIAMKAMSTEMNDRYHSVEDFQEAIRQYRITGTAEELYQRATTGKSENEYDEFQSSIALFSEAVQKWPNNERALVGNNLARKGFAKLALDRGDLDLGLHVIEGRTGPDFDELRRGLKKRRRNRTLVKRSVAVLLVSLFALSAFTVMVNKNFLEAMEQTQIAERDKEEAVKLASEAKSQLDEANQQYIAAKVQADEAQKLADSAQKKADAAVAREAELNEKITSLAAQEEKLRGEAEKAIMELAAKQKDLADANKMLATETEKAQQATRAAEIAQQSAEQAIAAATVADEKLKTVQKDITESILQSYDDRFNLYKTIGQFEKIDDLIKEMKEATDGENADLNRLLKGLIRNWSRELQLKRGRQFREDLKVGNLQDAVISRQGNVVAAASQSPKGGVIEIFVRSDAAADGVAFRSRSIPFETEHLTIGISPDEKFLTAIGEKEVGLWRVDENPPRAIPLTTKQPVRLTGKNVRVKFNNDATHLFVAGADDAMAMDVFDLRGESPVHVSHTQWEGSYYAISDFVLIADRATSSLFHVLFIGDMDGSRNCKATSVNLDPRAPRASLTEVKGLRRYDADNRPVPLEFLKLSGDQKTLAVGMGKSDVYFFPIAEGSDPFKNVIDESQKHEIGKISSQGDISSFAFSNDAQRLLVGVEVGLIEVWDWDQGQRAYVPTPEDHLWRLEEAANAEQQNAFRIAGLSRQPRALGFVKGDRQRVLAVGGTDSRVEQQNCVIEWNLSGYAKDLAVYRKLWTDFDAAIKEMLEEVRAEVPMTLRDSEAPGSREGEALPEIPFAETLEFVSFEQDPSAADRLIDRQWYVARNAQSARFSHDGQRILVAADDRAAHVYKRGSGMFMWMMGGRESNFYQSKNVFEEGHVPELSEIVFLPPNGDRLITRDFFGSISVWDAKKDGDGVSREIARLLSSDFGLAVSPDGKWIFAPGRQEKLVLNKQNQERPVTEFVGKIWKTEAFQDNVTPQVWHELTGQHFQFITAAAFSPDSSMIATADRRGTIVLWDVEQGEFVTKISGEHARDQVSGLAFLNDAEFVTTGFDGSIQRWILTRDGIIRANEQSQYRAHSDSEDPAAAGGKIISSVGDYIIDLAMSPDRTKFATLSVIKLSKDEIKQFQTSEVVPKRLRLMAWNVNTPQQPIVLSEWISKTRGSEFNQGLAWSNNSAHLAHLFTNETRESSFSELVIYEAADWTVANRLRPKGLGENSSSLAFAPALEKDAPERLATFDGRIAHLWNLSTGTHLAEFRSHETVFAAEFSFDRKYVATASDALRVFSSDETSGNLGLTLFRKGDAHRGRVDRVQFSSVPGNYDFATLGGDGDVKFWHWDPKQSTAPPEAPVETITLNRGNGQVLGWQSSLALSESGHLWCATYDGVLSCYSRDDAGSQAISLEALQAKVEFYCCTISRDEQSIAAGGATLSADGVPQQSFSAVWIRTEDGSFRLDAVFEGEHSSREVNDKLGTTAVHFLTEDGIGLLTGGADGKLLEWDWAPRDEDAMEPSAGSRIYSYPGRSEQSAHDAPVTSIDVSTTGDIVSTGEDGYVCFWPPAPGIN